jgi:hypothetical protein
MRYFTYIAEQSFKTAASGERLFYNGGPWSRPYIIPDPTTERRIYWKQVWMLRIILGGLIALQPFLYTAFPDLVREPLYFLSLLTSIVVLLIVARQIVLAPDLRPLSRASAPQSLRFFYIQMAERHSPRALWLGLGTCCMFVAGATWMLCAGLTSIVEAVIVMVFFAACATAWGYAILLKRNNA